MIQSLRKRNRAVAFALVAIIALIFAVTIVKIKIVGQMAVATPQENIQTPYGASSGVSSGDLPADKPLDTNAPQSGTNGSPQP